MRQLRNTPEETPALVAIVMGLVISVVAAATGSLFLAIWALALVTVGCAVFWLL